MIRILLVEPMNLLRGALAATLSQEEDLEVVADLGAAILRKTGARNRLEAVRLAEGAGWLQ